MEKRVNLMIPIKGYLLDLGVKDKIGQYGLLVYACIAVDIIVVANLIYFVIHQWQDMGERVVAFKGIISVVTYFLLLMSIIFTRLDVSRLVNMLGDFDFKYPYLVSTERRNLWTTLDNKLLELDKFWWIVNISYMTPFILLPTVVVCLRYCLHHEEFQRIIHEPLATPFPLYYPETTRRLFNDERLSNLLVYIIGYFLHSICMVFIILYAHLAYLISLAAMTNLEYEIKHLRLSLQEMDVIFKADSDAMRGFSYYMVRHHQEIYRRYNIVDRGINWFTGLKCANGSVYLCFSLYIITQKHNLFEQIQEFVFFFISGSIVLLFNVYGEKVKSEPLSRVVARVDIFIFSDELKDAFYKCSWVDKPKWFKTTLLAALARSNKAMEFKPFGLVNLNLNTFALTVNAAYSYYNLLRNFKEG